MYIQIIRGSVTDPAAFLAAADSWPTDLKPGATGYLGCTWGVSPDGTGIVAARFDSEASAQANNDRPEQGGWWSSVLSPTLTDPVFFDCADVDTMLDGGSDAAGFVQVIQGRAKDPAAAKAMMDEVGDDLAAARPDILGGVMAWHGDGGGFTQIMYFRSEQEARSGESTDMDPEVQAQYEAMMAEPPTFIDLPDPHFD